MESYRSLAESYDELTRDIPYRQWADKIEAHFRRRGIPGRTVLDLACGTGSMTAQLARRGYEMIGVDRSPEMLWAAQEKCRQLPQPPLFLCQSMEELDLYGTVDACICCLDSVNYLTEPKQLLRAFQRVHLFLMPGGVFLFDVNTLHKLKGLDGQLFMDESEHAYCVWRSRYEAKTRLCTYELDLFRLEEDGVHWQLSQELHRERAWRLRELHSLLRRAGFRDIRLYGEHFLEPPKPREQRVFFSARSGKAMALRAL